eukprot:2495324-Pyramimonas_sp.AAC.1
MPCLLCPGRLSRIAAAVRFHPLRTPFWCPESATPATLSVPGTHRGRAGRPPPAHPLWCRESTQYGVHAS